MMLDGKAIYNFAHELWDIPRSITGEGFRRSLGMVADHLPGLQIKSVPSGTKVFDWTVPREWEITEAYIIDPNGKKICDFSENNLHIVGYSAPFEGKLPLEELQKHLHSLPDMPTAIPFVTAFYSETWGFCISEDQRSQLPQGDYHVVVRSRLFDGVLNYGELVIPGQSENEVFLSTYLCHPSMANNELSGPCLLTFLGKWLKRQKELKYTYRLVFIPETIGSIVYISRNLENLKEKVFAGFNVTCVGDERMYSYLPSRNGNTYADKVAKHVLKWTDPEFTHLDWTDRGSDERQYCSPGVDLPVVCLMRSPYGHYPEYHTSLDTLGDVVTAKGLQESFDLYKRCIELIEFDDRYYNQVLCEPQLGKRGLYPNVSDMDAIPKVRLIVNILTYLDGNYTLIDLAERIGHPAWKLFETVNALREHGLIARTRPPHL